MSYFEELYSLNANEHTEEKNGLTYLSWAWAIAEVLKKKPDMTYEIMRFENELPYVYDEKTGYMVFTKVTIDGITREMWLPVMDGANKAMKKEPYEYTVIRYGKEVEKTCEAATMFDINKTIMRCLTKNLAMFGLGLYIYAGEDLPEGEEPKVEMVTPKQLEILNKLTDDGKQKIYIKLGINSLEELTLEQASSIIQSLKKGTK